VLKKKDNLSEADEVEIVRLEALVAEKCQDTNRHKVVDNLIWMEMMIICSTRAFGKLREKYFRK
jgi:hypothetical protein